MKRSFDPPNDGEGGDSSEGVASGGDSAWARFENPENSAAEQRRRRELNRLSKIRCRQRRKDLVRDLETRIACLSEEYNSLQTENQLLRREFALAWTSSQAQGGLVQNNGQANLSMLQSPQAFLDTVSANALLGTLDNTNGGWRQQDGVTANPTSSLAGTQNFGFAAVAGQPPQQQDHSNGNFSSFQR